MLVSDETQVAYKRWIVEMGSTQRCIVPILEGKFRELRHLLFECHVARRVWKMIYVWNSAYNAILRLVGRR